MRTTTKPHLFRKPTRPSRRVSPAWQRWMVRIRYDLRGTNWPTRHPSAPPRDSGCTDPTSLLPRLQPCTGNAVMVRASSCQCPPVYVPCRMGPQSTWPTVPHATCHFTRGSTALGFFKGFVNRRQALEVNVLVPAPAAVSSIAENIVAVLAQSHNLPNDTKADIGNSHL